MGEVGRSGKSQRWGRTCRAGAGCPTDTFQGPMQDEKRGPLSEHCEEFSVGYSRALNYVWHPFGAGPVTSHLLESL